MALVGSCHRICVLQRYDMVASKKKVRVNRPVGLYIYMQKQSYHGFAEKKVCTRIWKGVIRKNSNTKFIYISETYPRMDVLK
jgi:hypothetical protein